MELDQVEQGQPPGRAKDEARGILGTVRNATMLLELLAQGPAFQSVTATAGRSGLSIATAHRVLRSLAHAGLVRQSRRSLGYGLGPGLLRLAERYVAELPAVRALSPFLMELRNRTSATIEVCVLVEEDVICVDRVDGTPAAAVFRDFRRCRPATGSAAGQVLLGEATAADDSQPLAAGPSPYVKLVLIDSDELQVAVPVRSRSGIVVAALSATVALPSGRDVERRSGELARHLLRVVQLAEPAVDDE